MKIIIFLFALLLAIVGGIAFVQANPDKISLPFTKSATATINKQTFTLSIAKSAKEKEVGLSEKTSLSQNAGMLFPFDTSSPDIAFWMKNMKFPIDIIFINKNHIVTIYQNAQPPKSKEESLLIFKPDEPADSVLEINSGLSEKYKFKKGDEVKLENL